VGSCTPKRTIVELKKKEAKDYIDTMETSPEKPALLNIDWRTSQSNMPMVGPNNIRDALSCNWGALELDEVEVERNKL